MEEMLRGAELTEERKILRIQEEARRLQEIIEELRKGILGPRCRELIRLTCERWLGYFNNTKPVEGESLVQQAYRRIITDGMGVDPEYSVVVEETENKLVFHSYNWCPILGACEGLGLRTKHICRLIYQEPIEEICRKMIDPSMRFTRDYEKIRPNCSHCEEMFFIL